MTKKGYNIRSLLPIVILLAAIGVAFMIFSNPPSVHRGQPAKSQALPVQTQWLEAKPFTVNITSYGVVKPRIKTVLSAQTSGTVIYLNDNFREGGFFKKGELLLQLDDRDAKADVEIAKASVYDAEQALQEEQAKVEQAKADWQRLGKGEPTSPLVLREPQLKAAQASLMSAKARLVKAELTLERTKVVAPFNGRVLTQSVEIGQLVGNNTPLATIYASDVLEINLPVTNQSLAFIPLGAKGNAVKESINVRFHSDLTTQTWQGHVVRTTAAIDSSSQQLSLVAQIESPYSEQNQQQFTLMIGQYLTADIEGKTLEQAIVIPTKAIYQGSYVYIVEQGVLQRKEINIAWQDEQQALISSGLQSGQQLVITPLGRVTSGVEVSIIGDEQNSTTQQENNHRRKSKRGEPRPERMSSAEHRTENNQ
jgi:RND family efflux transporter MFP subunit